jgi:hypothetical protein
MLERAAGRWQPPASAALHVGAPDGERWHVAGATHAMVWSLSSLEHLFMRLRRAGSRYESALATLDLLPVTLCLS